MGVMDEISKVADEQQMLLLSTVLNLSALRSAARGDLVVTRLQLSNRAFCVAAPVAWNSLLLDIRSAPTLSTLKNMLKTHLLSHSYFSD